MNYLQKCSIVIFTLICLLISASGYSQSGKTGKTQESDEIIKKEITTALEQWNNMAKSRDTDQGGH